MPKPLKCSKRGSAMISSEKLNQTSQLKATMPLRDKLERKEEVIGAIKEAEEVQDNQDSLGKTDRNVNQENPKSPDNQGSQENTNKVK